MINTIPLNLSQRLKTLGVNKDVKAPKFLDISLYWWIRVEGESEPILRYGPHNGKKLRGSTCREKYPAYMLHELPKVLQQLSVRLGWAHTCEFCGCSIEKGYKDMNDEYSSVCKDCGVVWLSQAEFDEGHVINAWEYHFIKICRLYATTGEESSWLYLSELIK